jgi:hypothetical protein
VYSLAVGSGDDAAYDTVQQVYEQVSWCGLLGYFVKLCGFTSRCMGCVWGSLCLASRRVLLLLELLLLGLLPAPDSDEAANVCICVCFSMKGVRQRTTPCSRCMSRWGDADCLVWVSVKLRGFSCVLYGFGKAFNVCNVSASVVGDAAVYDTVQQMHEQVGPRKSAIFTALLCQMGFEVW